ncbi:MAG: leucyl/phenylalanyl-tRNA--protein transferase [Planctomycetes bacterium]|nr:leucyl/phenylalanyl-tRNA--protein transferase [Planctomycetota bacterium]
MHPELTPERLLSAYAAGIFPMADETEDIHWLAPDPRAIIELEELKISRSLRAVVRRGDLTMTIDRAFTETMAACANRAEGTWISADIAEAYGQLYRLGFGHSVEAWQGNELVGGLYGVAIGGAFFGESMFHRVADASKAALVHLVRRMRDRGLVLLDVQFMTDHLRRLGAREIPRSDYERRLHDAVRMKKSFTNDAPEIRFHDDQPSD